MNNPNASAAPAPETIPPDAQLMQLVSGAFVSAAIYTAAKLGIADLLTDGPKTAAKLAEETEMDERSLYRLLRSLASVGVFSEVESKTFTNTPMTETLRSDAPRSTRDLTIWMGEPEHWKVLRQSALQRQNRQTGLGPRPRRTRLPLLVQYQ
jgi:hypothetical protein